MAGGNPRADGSREGGLRRRAWRRQRRHIGSAEGCKLTACRSAAREGVRYLAASALALGVDFGSYVGLIRLAGMHYLVAAPVGFALGLATVYALSVRWVFEQRRLADRRVEFALFALIGLAGMALNQLIIYVCVQLLAASPELAKLVSAGMVFCFNFISRKLLLFTRS